MKEIVLIFALFTTFLSFSQRNVNYNFTINTTFTTNENFGDYDNFYDETDWNLLRPNALILRNGFDIEIASKITFGLNFGLDWHSDLEILTFPYFIDVKYALVQVDDDKLYIGAGAGKLLKFGNAFENGKYYKTGIGYYISTMKNYSIIFNVDFHQKQIPDYDNGRLNSLSFGLGMIFL